MLSDLGILLTSALIAAGALALVVMTVLLPVMVFQIMRYTRRMALALERLVEDLEHGD